MTQLLTIFNYFHWTMHNNANILCITRNFDYTGKIALCKLRRGQVLVKTNSFFSPQFLPAMDLILTGRNVFNVAGVLILTELKTLKLHSVFLCNISV